MKENLSLLATFEYRLLQLTAYFQHHAECDEILFINTLFYLLLILVVILKYIAFWYHSNDVSRMISLPTQTTRSLLINHLRIIVEEPRRDVLG